MRKEKGHATISDVAKTAGVSTATVSRVIAHNGYVAKKTRTKIEEAITSLHFQPSSIAQSLRRQHTRVIGLIVTDIQNPFYPELVRGVEDALQQRGYSLVLCNSSEDPIREESYLKYLASQRANAIIVCASGVVERQRALLEKFSGEVVIVNVPKTELKISTVTADDSVGGRLASEHLVKCGYPKVVYLGITHEEKDGYPRFNAVKAGAGKTPVYYFEAGDSLASSAATVQEILRKHKPPFGVIGHNDLIAIGAMHEFLAQGMKVPEQIGIVGYDNIAMSEFVSPSLTTISQEQGEFGKSAMAILEERFAGTTRVKHISITPKLVQRSSTMVLGKKR